MLKHLIKMFHSLQKSGLDFMICIVGNILNWVQTRIFQM